MILSNCDSRLVRGVSAPRAPVPVAGPELLGNGDMEVGDPPSNWIFGGGTFVVSSDTPSGTGAALQSTPTTTNARARQTVTLAAGWYAGAAQVKLITSTNSLIAIELTTGPYTRPFEKNATSGAAWQQLITTGRVPATADYSFFLDAVSWAGVALFDSASLKILTLSSLISTRPYASADCDISAAVTRTAGTQAGFAVRVDSPANPQNFIISYLDGAGNLKTDKCVAGTYTAIAALSGAVTYVAGQRPRIVCAGNDVSVYYNGTQVGATTAISDAGIVSNKNHGLFSTYVGNTFTSYTAA